MTQAEPSLAASAAEIHRVHCGERAYHLRIPSRADQIKYRRALAATGASFHRASDLCDALENAFKRLASDDARPGIVSLIDSYRDANDAFVALIVEADDEDMKSQAVADARASMQAAAAALEPYARAARSGDPVYAGMLADNEVYWDLAGLVASRMFLVAWEGIAAEFPPRGIDGLGDAGIDIIPAADLGLIGIGYDAMTRISPARRKNSATASPISEGAPISKT